MSARSWVFCAAAGALLAGAGCGGIGAAQSNLRSAVDAKKPALDGCYESALARNESVAGDMIVWVHVTEKGGTVSKAEVASSTLDDAELRQCVQTTLIGISVAPRPKANLKVEYTLQFSPST